MSVMLILYLKMMDQIGWELDPNEHKKRGNELYSEVKNAEFVPDAANQFVLQYFP